MATKGAAPLVEDYPHTLAELERRFSSEQACRAYLWALRWPNGFRCVSCRGEQGWSIQGGKLMECVFCHRQTSVRAGTIFADSRAPLVTWFRAMWYVTNQKSGVSAAGLQQALGLGSYETAWTWLHKLRRAMVRPGRDRLAGEVEVDETYVGGVEPGLVGRQTKDKAIVVIAVEVGGKKMGRIRMVRVADVSAKSLSLCVQATVTQSSVVHTDGWRGYNGLAKLGYKHHPQNISASGDPAHVVMPAVHRIASLLKRWLLGTHQGAVRTTHLDYYLDEFTFRFNRRMSRSRGKLFYRLVQQALATPPVPYRDLLGGRGKTQSIGTT